MTPKRRERILALYGHRCAFQGCSESSGLQIDHRIPLELGGSERDENLWPLCVSHHVEKTRDDMRRIRKAARIRRREAGEENPNKRKIRSRGFAKDPLR